MISDLPASPALPTIDSSSQFKRRLINLIFLLNLFPFFKFIPFINAEVQPVSGLIGAMFLLIFRQTAASRYYRWAMPYFFVLGSYSLMGLALVHYGEVELGRSIESLAIFLSPLFTFLALLQNLNLVSVGVFRFGFYAWAVISFCQQFFPAVLNATGISFILTVLIPRFSSESLAAWNRGVVAFAPEPSYGAHIILLMFAFGIFLYRQDKIGKPEFGVLSLLTLMMVYTNQSATMGFILAIFGIFYGFFECLKGGKAVVRMVSIVGSLFFLMFLGFSYFPEMRNIRLFEVFAQLFESLSGSAGDFDSVAFTNAQGSSRTISVKVGYSNLIQTHGFGSGMGGWGSHFLDAMENTGISVGDVSFFRDTLKNQVVNIKPYAYGAIAAFDLGIFGLGTLSLFFVRLLITRFQQSSRISAFSLTCFVSALVGIYYNSPSSLPVYWIFILLFLEGEEICPPLLDNNCIEAK
jgi:hypothetical protein